MIDIMSWNECEKEFIRKIEIDEARISSIMQKAMQRLERARTTKISIENVSFVVEDYYEVIKELLIAYLLKNGLMSKNYQCLITYFYKENLDYEKETHLITQMSFFRNRLNYYGEDIPKEFYDKNKYEFENIITLLKKLINTPSSMDYRGVVIEESLENKIILNKIKITKTKIEQVTEKHKTPWINQWTLHNIEIPENKADEIAEEISKSLDPKHDWYADFKNEKFHFIIFRNKIFKINRTSKKQYDEAKKYGISLGIPEYQVDFHPEIKKWER